MNGANGGAPAISSLWPVRHRHPRDCASRISSRAKRVFPMPGSPPTSCDAAVPGQHFIQEPSELGRFRMEPLDRDAPLEARVVSEKHLPHPAGTEQGVDAVAAGEQIGHL